MAWRAILPARSDIADQALRCPPKRGHSTLLHKSLGRPGQADAQPAAALPTTIDQVRRLSWGQLTLVFANQFASDMPSVANGDRDSLLRERLAALTSDERRLLREALSQPELV